LKVLPEASTDFAFNVTVTPLGMTLGMVFACLLVFAAYYVLRR
jgi:cell division protein FtsW (lipid II flippase)